MTDVDDVLCVCVCASIALCAQAIFFVLQASMVMAFSAKLKRQFDHATKVQRQLQV
jgi:hypothetical protein